MRKIFLVIFIFTATDIVAQKDTAKLLVGFPITSYMVDLNDSTKIVQVVPTGLFEIKEKQLGLIKDVYRNGKVDTTIKGFGRCSLIKGDYYYFPIHYGKDAPSLTAGDLLYTFMPMPDKYIGQLTKIAAHYISLQKVTEEKFYNRGDVFFEWNQQKETVLLDSMVNDLHFTGKYFLDNNPDMNKKIIDGTYRNKMMFDIMIAATKKDLSDFLDFVIEWAGKYAG